MFVDAKFPTNITAYVIITLVILYSCFIACLLSDKAAKVGPRILK